MSTRKPLADANQAAMASGFASNNLRNAEVIETMGMLPAIPPALVWLSPPHSGQPDPGL